MVDDVTRHGSRARWPYFERSPRAGGARWRLLMLLALVLALVALLPMIIAKTPLLNVVLSAAVPGNSVRIRARDASLSWIRGPSLSGIVVTDVAGAEVLAAEQISIDRAPLHLLLNPRELGVIEVIRPTLQVKIRPDGSNLEDLVQQLAAELSASTMDAAQPDASPTLALVLQLVEGTILAEDVSAGRRWRIDGLNVQYETRGTRGSLGQAALTGRIVELPRGLAQEVPAGRFSLTLQPTNTGQQQLSVQTEAVALAFAEPWLRRFVTQCEIGGALSGQAVANWSASEAAMPSDLTTSGMVTIDRLDVSATALAGDRLRLSRVELPWRIIAQPTGLAIEEMQLRSEIGQAAVRGRLDPKMDPTRHDLELRGVVDVARLAAMLPRAMHIRPGTTITSGTVDFAGRCQPRDGGQFISGSLRTSPLAATHAGQPLRWDEPVHATFALQRTNESLQLDTLRCDSQFLTIDASGNWQQFAANMKFDLDRLAEQLGQFIDLSDVRLAGTGTAHLAWRQPASGQLTATGGCDLAQFVVSLGKGGGWSEPQLAIRAEASGLFDETTQRPTRVDHAVLRVIGQGDSLDARLSGAVELNTAAPQWPVEIRAIGQIANWLTRARPFFAVDPWQVAGQGELSTRVRLSESRLEANEIKLNIADLRATAPGWNINEPRVEFTGDARWDATPREVSIRAAQLVTSTISLAARDVQYRDRGQGVGQLSGVAAFRSDLGRLAKWRAVEGRLPQYQPQGEVTGNIRFAQQGDRITGELSANGQKITLASLRPAVAPQATGMNSYEVIWQEPQLSLRGMATYDSFADRVTFDQVQLQSNTLQSVVAGSIDKLSSVADVNVSGTFYYDLAQLTPLLRPYVGSGIQLVGREQARFAMTGQVLERAGVELQAVGLSGSSSIRNPGYPLGEIHWSRRVRAQFELPWGGATVYGLPVGAGRMVANLSDGALRVEPLSLAVGEGRLTAAPQVRFDPEPAELSLPAGPLLTNVRISPEVSESMLKYVAPVLAGATQSEGMFSLDLDTTRVPLAEPKRADAAGRLTVHSVRVVPGPLAREVIGLAQQIEALAKRRDPTALAARPPVTLLAIRDQQVNFRMVEGRVHHQNLEFQVGEVLLRSQGFVGLDETLALTLSVPVQDSWISKEPLLSGLKGQVLHVPIGGTLTRPQLDQRAMANLSAQLLQNAAGQAIGNELNKALDKLFKPRQ